MLKIPYTKLSIIPVLPNALCLLECGCDVRNAKELSEEGRPGLAFAVCGKGGEAETLGDVTYMEVHGLETNIVHADWICTRLSM